MKLTKILILVILIGTLLLIITGVAQPARAADFECASPNQTTIPEAECNALKALYNATNSPGWTNSTGWLNFSNPCTWYGVECYGSGHVIWLHLDYNGLAGDLPAGLDALSFMQDLNLWNNDLTGKIPSDIGNTLSLQNLNLGNNLFTGNIPSGLGSFSNLKILDLRVNQLDGSIPPELGNLDALTHLNLSNNQLTGEIPPGLGDMSSLIGLVLANNQLEGNIPDELGDLISLEHLQLDINQLTGNIPAALGNLTTLYSLTLSNNQLSGSIPPELGQLTSLSQLLLYDNQLDGNIPADLADLASLNWMDLSYNQLTGRIPPAFGRLDTLSALYLDNNQLSGNLPSQLGNMDAIRYIKLHDNQLTGAIPPSFGNLSTLEDLRIENNPMFGPLPLELAGLTSLQYLHINDTGLCEPDDAAFQAWLGELTDYQGTGICGQDMFYSMAANDGWVLESGENTGTGGSLNTTNLTCYIGDDAAKKQYRTFLHFNTSRLPDNAVITKAELQYKQHSFIGTDPFTDHGNLWTDIKSGFFNNDAILVLSDFGAASSMNNAGVFSFIPSSLAYPLYRTTLKSTALQYLNLTGITQFRLRFAVDDDNDSTADYIKIFCGDIPEPFNRPVLRVWYYVP